MSARCRWWLAAIAGPSTFPAVPPWADLRMRNSDLGTLPSLRAVPCCCICEAGRERRGPPSGRAEMPRGVGSSRPVSLGPRLTRLRFRLLQMAYLQAPTVANTFGMMRMQRSRRESWPEKHVAFSPLPARGQGTHLTPALQWPLRRRPRRSRPPLRGRVRWTYRNIGNLHARPAWPSVASPPTVPPVDALHHWRTRVLRRGSHRGKYFRTPRWRCPWRQAV